MALSEYEENILAELENDFKGESIFNEDELKEFNNRKDSFDDGTGDGTGSFALSFDPKEVVIGFFGVLFGLCLILFAVYSYSNFGVWATVISAIAGFGLMVFSISKFMQIFTSKIEK